MGSNFTTTSDCQLEKMYAGLSCTKRIFGGFQYIVNIKGPISVNDIRPKRAFSLERYAARDGMLQTCLIRNNPNNSIISFTP